MSRELIIRKPARIEAAEAYDWYEERKRGLGEEFLTAIEAVLAVVQRTSERFAVVLDPVRKARLRRFPYATYYIWQDQLISVVAIFRAKRNPEILFERLRETKG